MSNISFAMRRKFEIMNYLHCSHFKVLELCRYLKVFKVCPLKDEEMIEFSK
jgi:hypothetical protein